MNIFNQVIFPQNSEATNFNAWDRTTLPSGSDTGEEGWIFFVIDHKGLLVLLLFLLLSGVLGKKFGLNVTRNRLIVSECHRERRGA